MTEIEWTKHGIINWMNEVDVFQGRNHTERQKLVNFFIDEANKHQDTSMDRKLYRKGLKVVEATTNREAHYTVFMGL